MAITPKMTTDLSQANKTVADVEKMINEMKYAKTHAVKVGVMGVDNTTVMVATVHEKGGKNMPKRSFIEATLLKEKINDIKRVIKGAWQKVVLGKMTAKKGLELIGVQAENYIDEAFETAGFGKWQALKPATIMQRVKKVPAFKKAKTKEKKKEILATTKLPILIDTGKLRSSISSAVVKGK